MKQLGRYEILEVLGEGAMGTVYRAHDPKINRTVAIKVVRVMGVTPEQEAEYRRRFFREAQSSASASCPTMDNDSAIVMGAESESVKRCSSVRP